MIIASPGRGFDEFCNYEFRCLGEFWNNLDENASFGILRPFFPPFGLHCVFFFT